MANRTTNKSLNLKLTIGAAILFSNCNVRDESCFAHDDHSHSRTGRNSVPTSRTWTFETTGAHIHASFLSAKDQHVQLERTDGKSIRVAINDLSSDDQKWIQAKIEEVRKQNEKPHNEPLLISYTATEHSKPPAVMEACFEPFAKLKSLTYRVDQKFLFVESNGMPDHRMMVGITAWQQQVPIPQRYAGNNAWQIPMFPVEASDPLSAKSHFFRGAIALAANGVPIFNPIKNDGRTDTFLAGELDEFGGHCGRADDYHYHIAPTHLQKIVGAGNPIAYALDGYPIYGFEEPDGSPVKGLDSFNGHHTDKLGYHYHASKTYPYINGGFHGVVVERDGQVDPQPRANSFREALPPLKGAKIVDFVESPTNHFVLTYDVQGKKGTVEYTLAPDGTAQFQYIDPNGSVRNEQYQGMRRNGQGGGGPAETNGDRPRGPGKGPGGGDRSPGNGGRGNSNGSPKEPSQRPTRNNESTSQQRPLQDETSTSKFSVTSTAIKPNGLIDAIYTCDGKSLSPPMEWKDAPKETKYFVVSLWHTAPDQEKSYWLVYNIPSTITSIVENKAPEGVVGLNDKRKTAYDPMCSKGPGRKTYHLTVYAISAKLDIPPNKANRAAILESIKPVLLSETTVDFDYERPSK